MQLTGSLPSVSAALRYTDGLGLNRGGSKSLSPLCTFSRAVLVVLGSGGGGSGKSRGGGSGGWEVSSFPRTVPRCAHCLLGAAAYAILVPRARFAGLFSCKYILEQKV